MNRKDAFMSNLYDPDLTQWLQLSGEYIARVRPAEERTDWIRFLLAEIKAQLPPEEYCDLLRKLDASIRSDLDQAKG
jgi:hypothetical protein